MSDISPPQMPDDYRSRMRRGLSTLVVREKVREQRRKRAIASGAALTAIVATVGVVSAQLIGPAITDSLQAGPTQPPAVTEVPTLAPSETPVETPPPTASPSSEATTRPEVAASGPIVLEFEESDCGPYGCETGDAAAGGPWPETRKLDAYALCGPSGRGQVLYGGQLWVDCAQAGADVGVVQFGLTDYVVDGDPKLTASDDFDGQIALVPQGQAPSGQLPVDTVTVFLGCNMYSQAVTVGDVSFGCQDDASDNHTLDGAEYAATGVPVASGALAPAVSTAHGYDLSQVWLRYRLER